MKLIAIYTLFLLSTLTLQAGIPPTKEILDKSAAIFKAGGGTEIDFTVTSVDPFGKRNNAEKGNIKVKEDSFVLTTGSTISWFDGQTLWSYLISGDEVNISNPSEEELQHINPYSLLNMYKKGFGFKTNGTKTFQGKNVYEVVLTPTNKKQELSGITIYITTDYRPVYIRLDQKNKAKSEINLTSFKTGQNYSPSQFKFDKNKYLDAEIIDLR